jgi:hypothetical protein
MVIMQMSTNKQASNIHTNTQTIYTHTSIYTHIVMNDWFVLIVLNVHNVQPYSFVIRYNKHYNTL